MPATKKKESSRSKEKKEGPGGDVKKQKKEREEIGPKKKREIDVGGLLHQHGHEWKAMRLSTAGKIKVKNMRLIAGCASDRWLSGRLQRARLLCRGPPFSRLKKKKKKTRLLPEDPARLLNSRPESRGLHSAGALTRPRERRRQR